MGTVLFVHGTGVREDSYNVTYAVLEKKMAGWPQKLAPCVWGDKYGAKFPKLSLPDVDVDDSGEYPLWSLLAEDPLYELELIAAPTSAPGRSEAPFVLWKQISGYKVSQKLNDILDTCGLKPYWDFAWKAVIENRDLAEKAVTEAPGDAATAEANANDAGCAIARAVTAALMQRGVENGAPAIPIVIRQGIFQQLVDDWECQTRGGLSEIWNAAKEKLGFVADWAGTKVATAHRNDLVKEVGDILVYQGRGEDIRNCIREHIDMHAKKGPVAILAHSLGGIACLDILVEAAKSDKPVPGVSHFITAGSQAPYLWELNAMVSMKRNEILPKPFPKWLNFFDPNDLLSYRARPIFGDDNVTDVRVESGLPSLHAHSAYWLDDAVVWPTIKEFLG
jgi:hypothetical protein